MQLRLQQYNIYIYQVDEATQWSFHLPVFLYWELEQPHCRSPPLHLIAIQEIQNQIEGPAMGFNYAHEEKKFHRAWIRTARQYREAGMCCEQINAMEEFEIQQFNQLVAVRRNTVTVPPADFWSVAPESVHTDGYFQDVEEYLDELLDDIRPGFSVKLIQQDKEILKNIFRGKNQRETAEILGLTQQTVSYRLKRIKKIFRNLL